MIQGEILTPFSLESKSCFGAIYKSNKEIVVESLRKSTYAGIKHQDPVYFGGEIKDKIDHNFLYLGHYFSMYGHFLIETLPMVWHILENKNWDGEYMFLSWGKTNKTNLMVDLFEALDEVSMLERIKIHNTKDVLRSNFFVIERPVEINHNFINKSPYLKIIDKLKISKKSEKNLGDRIFLCRDNSRVNPDCVDEVYSTCKNQGFEFIYPEEFSLNEQISIMSNAKIIAGFEGSNLHNSIFLDKGSKIIEFGSQRMQHQGNPNQYWLSKMLEMKLKFIPHCDSGVVEKVNYFLNEI